MSHNSVDVYLETFWNRDVQVSPMLSYVQRTFVGQGGTGFCLATNYESIICGLLQ